MPQRKYNDRPQLRELVGCVEVNGIESVNHRAQFKN